MINALRPDGRRIIASGTTFTEAFEKAQTVKAEGVSFEKRSSLNWRLFRHIDRMRLSVEELYDEQT
jgi:S-adenosylmethionine:tRNA-ribosyltransferase-isomerase (queuine synthetase)